MLVIICLYALTSGSPSCSDPVDSNTALAYVALANQSHPFNDKSAYSPMTIFLPDDRPKDSGVLVLPGLTKSVKDQSP